MRKRMPTTKNFQYPLRIDHLFNRQECPGRSLSKSLSVSSSDRPPFQRRGGLFLGSIDILSVSSSDRPPFQLNNYSSHVVNKNLSVSSSDRPPFQRFASMGGADTSGAFSILFGSTTFSTTLTVHPYLVYGDFQYPLRIDHLFNRVSPVITPLLKTSFSILFGSTTFSTAREFYVC